MAYQQQQIHPQYAQGQNVQSQEWQNSLMDCGPCDTCLLGTCLPCVLLGQTSERIRDPANPSPDAFNGDCMIMCGISYLTGCGWIYAMIKRTEIRERYGISGDGTSDCCAAYWCGCCALIQQEKEVKARNAQGPIVQGYQPEKHGMVMPSPQPQHPQQPQHQGEVQYHQQPQHQGEIQYQQPQHPQQIQYHQQAPQYHQQQQQGQYDHAK